MIERVASGSPFRRLGISGTGDRLYAADFGDMPGVRTYGGDNADLTRSQPFVNPFEATCAYAPFSAQDLAIGGTSAVFVTDAAQESAGKETHHAGLGRLARYDEAGNLIAVAADRGLLNSPWALALAPADFGAFSNALLVGNFGDGTIVGFDPATLTAINYLRGADGEPLAISGLWRLTFGNGASLGASNALYFAAGAEDETQEPFGRITDAPEPASCTMLLMGVGLIVPAIRRRGLGSSCAAATSPERASSNPVPRVGILASPDLATDEKRVLR